MQVDVIIFVSVIAFSPSINITPQIQIHMSPFREKYKIKFLARQHGRCRGFHTWPGNLPTSSHHGIMCMFFLLPLYTPSNPCTVKTVPILSLLYFQAGLCTFLQYIGLRNIRVLNKDLKSTAYKPWYAHSWSMVSTHSYWH